METDQAELEKKKRFSLKQLRIGIMLAQKLWMPWEERYVELENMIAEIERMLGVK